MKQAIQKAIEAGYKDKYGSDTIQLPFGAILLDPLFWQSLGKAMGWKKLPNFSAQTYQEREGWLEMQHRFIDHLAKGGGVEEYFKELLTNQ